MRTKQTFSVRTKLFWKAAGVAAVTLPAVLACVNASPIPPKSPAQSAVVNATAFEVASIKPTRNASSNGTFNVGVQFTPDGFDAANSPVILLIESAYGVSGDRISGAENWVIAEGFDIEAKMERTAVENLKNLSADERKSVQQRMLQTLLADRFKLIVHQETKDLAVYALVIAKNGSKLKDATSGDTYANGIKGPDGRSLGPDMISIGRGLIRGQAVPMSTLVQALARQLDRPVVDRTGLTGRYDFNLEWTPGQSQGQTVPERLADGTPSVAPPDPVGTSLFLAVQERLGLKLEPKKDSIISIVIDHVERPSKN